MAYLSVRTIEQLLSSGRGRGYYAIAYTDGIGYKVTPADIPGYVDRPRSSGMAPVGGDAPEDMWAVWSHGWLTYCRWKREAQCVLQRGRWRSRNQRQEELRDPPVGRGPESNQPHIGVEIECCVPGGERDRLYRLLSAIRGVGVTHDGSIRAPEGHAAVEVRICGPEGAEIERRVRLACAVLRSCKAVVNISCGLHVHIDARPEVGRIGEEVWARLMASQRLLLAMQPRSRRENKYCRRARGKDWRYASGRRRGGRAQRYRAINALSYREHKTIEVRCHTGTIRAGKILAWVELLVRIAGGAAGTGGIKPTKRSLKGLGLSEAAMAYVLARLELFGPKVWRKVAFRDSQRALPWPIVGMPPREEAQGEYEGDLAAA